MASFTSEQRNVKKILKEKSGIQLDIGCGENKMPGFVGMDYRKMPGVDVVWDVMNFPWPIPTESVNVAVASHLVEHISPDGGDQRIEPLIKLLLKKKLISKKDVKAYIGETNPGPRFMRFMDEVWRVLKVDGEFAMVFPYAGSPGFYQDPTHINNISEMTWEYFDPLSPRAQGQLYGIYMPKPWKIKVSAWKKTGNMEVVLIKRKEDPSYYKDVRGISLHNRIALGEDHSGRPKAKTGDKRKSPKRAKKSSK